MNIILREMLSKNNITVAFEESFHNDPATAIDAIKVKLL